MDNLKILKDNNYKANLIERIKERILEFNQDLLASSVVAVVANVDKRRIYSSFIDYYIFHLSDVSFYDLATDKDFQEETTKRLNDFAKAENQSVNSFDIYKSSKDYVQSLVNIIVFKSIIINKEIKYGLDYKKHLYSYILNDERVKNIPVINRKMKVEKYSFCEISNIVENELNTDVIYLELIKLISFYKITPSAKEVYDFISYSLNKTNKKRLFVELPVFDNDEDLYPFLKITYPEDTVFVAENIPIFLEIGKALRSLEGIEINVVVPMVDTERELDFIQRSINDNHKHEMIFHLLLPYNISFRKIQELKKYKTLILDFANTDVNNHEELMSLIKENETSIRDVRETLRYRREVSIKTPFLDKEKIINYFVNRGYRTFYYDGKADRKQIKKEMLKIKKRRKTMKVTF